MIERTFIMLKPDAVRRGLVGEILAEFERKGFKIVALKMLLLSKEMAEEHYAEHKGKDFYEPLLEFITSAPVVAAVIEGESAIEQVRKLIGATDCKKAQPGTIRFRYGLSNRYNLIHASDSPAKAEEEIRRFFSDEEILNYKTLAEEYAV